VIPVVVGSSPISHPIFYKPHSAVEVASRLGITDKSLYRWKAEADKRLKQPDSKDVSSLKLEIAISNTLQD
jgi:transposase-like protein